MTQTHLLRHKKNFVRNFPTSISDIDGFTKIVNFPKFLNVEINFFLCFLVAQSLILNISERNLLHSHEDIYSQKNWRLCYRASQDGD